VTQTKRCKTCKRLLPQTTEYFRWRKDRGKFISKCRECEREYQSRHFKKIVEAKQPRPYKRRAFRFNMTAEDLRQIEELHEALARDKKPVIPRAKTLAEAEELARKNNI